MILERTNPEAGQRWDTTLYDEKHSFVWRYGEDLLDVLRPQPGEYVLDVGAGTGHLTARIAESGARVLGMDASPEMVDEARGLYPLIEFVQGDAADFEFPKQVDAVFSNATLHWVKRAEDAVRCIAACLKPGGRFVAELGGHGNVQGIITGLRDAREALGYRDGSELSPWYFPSIGEYTGLLERHGLEVTFATLTDRPTLLDGDDGMLDWLNMFTGAFVADLQPRQRAILLASIVGRLRQDHFKSGAWYADYRRLRIVAHKVR